MQKSDKCYNFFTKLERGGFVKKSIHDRTPLFDALKEYSNNDIAPFDVPGHKMGSLRNEFSEYLGTQAMRLDVNAPKGIDALNKHTGVIAECEMLLSDAFGSDTAFMLVNGTSSGIIAMIMATCSAKEKIILPRNAHKSAISALIFSGAIPIFVEPDLDEELGIANGVSYENIEKAILENPDAKAVMIINPTYFGVVSDLKEIIRLVHEHDMVVLVDEAHGSHFGFSPYLPESAMSLGADMAALSIHKTGGSLTQSSLLLVNERNIDVIRVKTILNMMQSTSPSSFLLASLDVARKTLVMDGEELLEDAIIMTKSALEQINEIKGLKAITKEYIINRGNYDFDPTKLIIKVSELGLSGFEVYNILATKYQIQVELAETYVILCVISLGTKRSDILRLVYALQELSDEYYQENNELIVPSFHYKFPSMFVRPREAFHAPVKYVSDEESIGEVSAESIMIYPPGIPLIIPGEVIERRLIEMMKFYEAQGSTIICEHKDVKFKIIDQDNWVKGNSDDDL